MVDVVLYGGLLVLGCFKFFCIEVGGYVGLLVVLGFGVVGVEFF